MKSLNQILLVSILVSTLSSCQKFYDYTDINKHKPGPSKCIVTGIEYEDPSGNVQGKDTLQFNYDAKGNLLSMERNVSNTGVANFYFEYDNKGRVSRYYLGTRERSLPYAAVLQYHVLSYDNRSRIIADTVYVGPVLDGDNVVYSPMIYHSSFKYDNKGRIVQEIVEYTYPENFEPQFQTRNFVYNKDGNREGRTYDENLSFLSSNDLLMFLQRDYSVNNPLEASSFNTRHYPVDITQQIDYFDLYPFTDLRILYACK